MLRKKRGSIRFFIMVMLAFGYVQGLSARCTKDYIHNGAIFDAVQVDLPVTVPGNFLPITPWIEVENYEGDCDGDPGRLRLLFVPGNKTITYSENGKTYSAIERPATPVEDSGPFSVILEVTGMNSDTWIPITAEIFPIDLPRQTGKNRWRMRARLGMRSDIPRPNTYSVGFSLLSAGNSDGSNYNIIANASVVVHQRTCTTDSALTVESPGVGIDRFDGVNSVVEGKSFTLNLNCPPGLRVDAVLTDASDATNRTSVLSLRAGSTASGVGYQIMREGNVPIYFGPPSTLPGTLNKFPITSIPSTGGNIELPLRVMYIQTERDIEAGSVEAVATITFSYQ